MLRNKKGEPFGSVPLNDDLYKVLKATFEQEAFAHPMYKDPSSAQLGRMYTRRNSAASKLVNGLREKLEALDDEASQLALDRLENLDTLGKPDFDAVMLPLGGRSLLSIAPSLARQ